MGRSADSNQLLPIQFDVAALHTYPNGREPIQNLDTNIGNIASVVDAGGSRLDLEGEFVGALEDEDFRLHVSP